MSSSKHYVAAQDIVDCIKEHQSFVICGHVSPDGDCLGSQLALMHALNALDKQVVCLLAEPDSVDSKLSYLPGLAQMVVVDDYVGQPDAVIAVDVSDARRMGEGIAALFEKAPVTLAIDHHHADGPLAKYTYADLSAASATLLVWEVLSLLDIVRTKDMATCAYTGLMTDTGRFQFQNTNPECFLAAATMVETGADPSFIAQQVFQNQPLATLRLEEVALSRMQLGAKGRYVMSYLKQSDFDKFSAAKTDADPLINTLRSIEGVEVACILREDRAQGVRGSLRAKGTVDVEAIARTFGGGGHKAAAGLSLEVPIEKAVEQVSSKLDAVFSGSTS